MKLKRLLLCSLLLGTFFNPSLAMNNRHANRCEKCANLCLDLFAFGYLICVAYPLISVAYCSIDSRCLHEMPQQNIPFIAAATTPNAITSSVAAPWDCNAGYLYGLHDATNKGTFKNIMSCEGFKSKKRRKQIRKEFLENTEPNIITHCRSGFYVGLTDGGAIDGQATNNATQESITKMCPHLISVHKEKLKNQMKRD